MEIFKVTGIMITTEGKMHLGTATGSPEFKSNYTKNLVDKWVLELQELSKIAKTEPHTQTLYSVSKWSGTIMWDPFQT